MAVLPVVKLETAFTVLALGAGLLVWWWIDSNVRPLASAGLLGAAAFLGSIATFYLGRAAAQVQGATARGAWLCGFCRHECLTGGPRA